MFKKNISFIRNESGAVLLLPFIILLPIIIGLLFLSFEISHFIQKKAKLSDAIEQATLALTVENDSSNPNELQAERNTTLVMSYAHAYLPSEIFSAPEIEIIKHLTHLEYRVTTTLSYAPQFLTKSPITNTDKNIHMTDSAVARKNIFVVPTEKTDVVFVVDYSSSMDEPFNKREPTKKIDELRRIFKRLNSTILKNENIQSIGFVPFTWGTKIIEDDAKIYCHFPFVPKAHMPFGNYLENLEGYKQEITPKTMDAIKNHIDYNATINSITNITKTYSFINIPIVDVISYSICLKASDAYTLSSGDISNDNIQKNIEQRVGGDTLISSGMLVGNKLLRESNSTNNNKLMVILSDGIDSGAGIEITSKLMAKGMCDKIKENNIRMVFIAIGYTPQDIDWKKCVGEENYYLAKNAYQLEADLHQALGSTEIREVGRNTPKD